MSDSIALSHEIILLLIEQYRLHPVLWDVKNPIYKNRVKRNIALETISKRINLPS